MIGHHVLRHVEIESGNDPEECKLLPEMVDHNVKGQQGRLLHVMIKIAQVIVVSNKISTIFGTNRARSFISD